MVGVNVLFLSQCPSTVLEVGKNFLHQCYAWYGWINFYTKLKTVTIDNFSIKKGPEFVMPQTKQLYENLLLDVLDL